MLNCRLLGTGVNVPEVGMVAISSRRWSHVDILQMAGRAARVAPGKECGYVLLPTRMDGLGDYSTVYQTLRAFIDQDDELRQRLDDAVFGAGRRGSSHIDTDEIFGPDVMVPVDMNLTLMRREFGAVLYGIAKAEASFDIWMGRLQVCARGVLCDERGVLTRAVCAVSRRFERSMGTSTYLV